MGQQDLKSALNYIHSEINRIETMAGTLSTTEREHYNKLSSFNSPEMMDIAIEEQNTARQLGTMKEICLAMSGKLEGIKNAIDQGEISGGIEHD